MTRKFEFKFKWYMETCKREFKFRIGSRTGLGSDGGYNIRLHLIRAFNVVSL